MDDEKLAVQLNLNDFESMFELKTNAMSEEVRLKKEAGKLSEKRKAHCSTVRFPHFKLKWFVNQPGVF